MEFTSDEEVDAKVKKMFGMTVDQWNAWMIGFLIVTVVATAGSIASQFIIIKLQKAEAIQASRDFEMYKLGVFEKVEDARKEGVEAGRTASDALVRAAALEKEAAFARLETEQLKTAVTWRTIPPEMGQKLGERLKLSPGGVNLRYIDGDPEALYLAIQISEIMTNAGWQVAPGAIKPINSIFFGISISQDASPTGQALKQAFTEAEISFSNDDIQIGAAFNIQMLRNAPTLMIGSRRPAVLKK
ncbi:hypothetical protein [Agrobacterium rosae]|uniref:hypothetical protein n=1 Tax=Agrobacterium rosae TaxID=1972867 RepID=UPI00122F602B|nr:hypothetical protein [Agrobacterium rosae]KAA3510077.1 hypothetical protein DXM21_19790 [Agrobacterium rosae]KAA3514978.1 hypothetical protein DXM25_20580 [Agrobacterium rosae]MQB50696.1 hypothetical protein [Agrobacterium rosae]